MLFFLSARVFIFLISLVFLSPAFAADPNFTGKWRLNEARSEIRALPVRPASELKLLQEGTTVKCSALIPSDQEPRDCSFTTDGKESRNSAAGATHSTRTKWEGAALLVNTIVSAQTRQHTQMDRWKLSRDGSSLTIRRVVVALHGEMESTLVYERVAETAPQ